MNIPAIRAALDAVEIPHSSRTIGSEQAVESLEARPDGLHMACASAFPPPLSAKSWPNAFRRPCTI